MPDQILGGAPEERASRGFSSLATALPSLDWTLLRLTGVWAQDGEMIRCPLPGHEDSTPSFNLWAADDSGSPQRFGCFGCGRRGDVVDLIAELEQLDQVHALVRAGELATEELTDDTPRERTKPVTVPTRDFDLLLKTMAAQFGSNELTVFQKYMVGKGLGGEDLEQYVMEEWEWTVGEQLGRRVVAFPHRTREGKITAIKYRTLDRKWHENGSKFPSLYGAWRDQGRQRVVLCEGETDALWTAWALREDDVDVMALPSGAGQGIQDEWVEQLKGRDLTITFDSDEEGMKAARRWCAVFPDALLARLPEEEDMLSCGVPVRELLQRARTPQRHGGQVVIGSGVFAKQQQNALVPVADFAFIPLRELYTEEGPAWEGQITGDRQLSLIRATDLHSVSTMTRWANRNGRAWFGSGPSAQGVLNWLMAESAFMPLERAVTKAGKIGRSYVGPGFCIGPDKMRYVPPALGDAKLDTRLRIQEGGWDPRAIIALERLNEPEVMATILGWLCASLLRGQRAPAPPLFIAGESGAGKTHLLSRTLGAFGFSAEVNLTTTTPYGVDCMVNSCVGFPVWFDEYRGGAREDSMLRLRQLLRDAYNGQPSMKGGMTSQATELTEVSTWSAMVVSGEMSSRETSHRDRLVMIDLNPDARNREAYEWLRDLRRTAGLGYELLTFLAARPDTLFQVNPVGDASLPDRFRDTLGFVQAGWEAWKHFRWEQGLRDSPADPAFERLSGERAQSEDPWLEAIKACEGVSTRDGDFIVHQEDDGVLIIPSEVIVEARRIGIELPARSSELVSWLTRRYPETKDERIGISRRRAKRVKGMVL